MAKDTQNIMAMILANIASGFGGGEATRKIAEIEMAERLRRAASEQEFQQQSALQGQRDRAAMNRLGKQTDIEKSLAVLRNQFNADADRRRMNIQLETEEELRKRFGSEYDLTRRKGEAEIEASKASAAAARARAEASSNEELISAQIASLLSSADKNDAIASLYESQIGEKASEEETNLLHEFVSRVAGRASSIQSAMIDEAKRNGLDFADVDIDSIALKAHRKAFTDILSYRREIGDDIPKGMTVGRYLELAKKISEVPDEEDNLLNRIEAGILKGEGSGAIE